MGEFDVNSPTGRLELDEFLRRSKSDLDHPNSNIDNGATDPNKIYPDHNDGFVGGVALPRTFQSTENLTFTRYIRKNSDPTLDSGNFVSIGDPPFTTRALPGLEAEYDKITYRIKPGENMSGTTGRATPWFTKPGGANQVMLDDDIATLLQNSVIEIIPD